jgi:hypothetical protein
MVQRIQNNSKPASSTSQIQTIKLSNGNNLNSMEQRQDKPNVAGTIAPIAASNVVPIGSSSSSTSSTTKDGFMAAKNIGQSSNNNSQRISVHVGTNNKATIKLTSASSSLSSSNANTNQQKEDSSKQTNVQFVPEKNQEATEGLGLGPLPSLPNNNNNNNVNISTEKTLDPQKGMEPQSPSKRGNYERNKAQMKVVPSPKALQRYFHPRFCM